VAILVGEETRLLVQGLTGSEGRMHGLRNRIYGTNVVAGVTPGREGQDVEGIPVYSAVAAAVAETAANAALVFVPAAAAADAVYESIDAGIATVVCITEFVPVHDTLRLAAYARAHSTTLIGPNCPGVLSPGRANVGIIPAGLFAAGSVGLVSRSGTLTYEIGHALAGLGLGNSTVVGIGGDPVVGTGFVEIIDRFLADPETELVVVVGEIGGDAEERTAEHVARVAEKPVLAYIAGFAAPPGKRMGHAGAIVTRGSGTAEAKRQALEAAGIAVGRTPSELARLVAERLGKG
jgi:succinyl-CoA synthetase alpha subunit